MVDWAFLFMAGMISEGREFVTSLEGSKLVGIQFTVRKASAPLLAPKDFSIRGKIAKTNLFS